MTTQDCLSLCNGVVAHAGWDGERDKDKSNGSGGTEPSDTSLQSKGVVRTTGLSLSHHRKSGTEILLPLQNGFGGH